MIDLSLSGSSSSFIAIIIFSTHAIYIYGYYGWWIFWTLHRYLRWKSKTIPFPSVICVRLHSLSRKPDFKIAVVTPNFMRLLSSHKDTVLESKFNTFLSSTPRSKILYRASRSVFWRGGRWEYPNRTLHSDGVSLQNRRILNSIEWVWLFTAEQSV